MTDDLRTAAVLVPVFRDAEGELRIVLVVRADDGGQHGGQLGLPGGKPEPGDADLLATALREAQEEVGLDPEAVDVVASARRRSRRARRAGSCIPSWAASRRTRAWRLQETEIVGILTPAARALADPASRSTAAVLLAALPRAAARRRDRRRGPRPVGDDPAPARRAPPAAARGRVARLSGAGG